MRRLTIYFESDKTKNFKTTESFKNIKTVLDCFDLIDMAVESRNRREVKSDVLKVQWGHEMLKYVPKKKK